MRITIAVCLPRPSPANSATLRLRVPTAVGLASEAALHGCRGFTPLRLLQKDPHLLKVKGHGIALEEIVADHPCEMKAKSLFPGEGTIVETWNVVFLYAAERKTADHFMVGWGRVESIPPVLLFVDSGLAGAGVKLVESAIKEAKIKLEKDKATQRSNPVSYARGFVNKVRQLQEISRLERVSLLNRLALSPFDALHACSGQAFHLSPRFVRRLQSQSFQYTLKIVVAAALAFGSRGKNANAPHLPG